MRAVHHNISLDRRSDNSIFLNITQDGFLTDMSRYDYLIFALFTPDNHSQPCKLFLRESWLKRRGNSNLLIDLPLIETQALEEFPLLNYEIHVSNYDKAEINKVFKLVTDVHLNATNVGAIQKLFYGQLTFR